MHPRINSFGNQRDGDPEFLRGHHGPFAGAFLAGGIEDLIHERLAILVLETREYRA